MKTADEILHEHGIAPSPPGKHRYYTTCPQCSANRSRAHQKAAGTRRKGALKLNETIVKHLADRVAAMAPRLA